VAIRAGVPLCQSLPTHRTYPGGEEVIPGQMRTTILSRHVLRRQVSQVQILPWAPSLTSQTDR